jgi:putative flippase GtrA
MDVDLSTGLEALVPLVAPLLSGQSDLAIGTRLARGAHVVRGARRELISRCYNLLLRSVLRSSCTDAQCGFKAMRREASLELVPLVQDDMWFFDTEMLVMAQRLGFRIHEVPVHWVDDTDSRVDVIRTALMDLRGMWRLLGPSSRHRVESSSRLSGGAGGQYPASHAAVGRPAAAPGASARRGRTSGGNADTDGDWDVFADDLLRFAGVGVLSTSVYVGLFAVLRPGLGSYAANAVAIGICSVANPAVHRSIVGASRCRYRFGGRWAGATGLLAVSLGLTTLALVATRAIGLDSLVPQLFALTIANLTAAVIRFGVLRTWIFPPAYGRSLTYAFHNEDGTRADPRPARPPTGTTIEETRS